MTVHERRPRTDAGPAAVVGGALAALLAAAAFGLVLLLTGRLASVAELYGLGGRRWGGLLLVVHSLLAGLLFAGVLGTFWGDDAGLLRGTAAGVGYGVLLWAVVVALALPLWTAYSGAEPRPLPYLHWISLAGLVCYGAVLGLVYSITIRVRPG